MLPDDNLVITAQKILNADKPEDIFGLFATKDKDEMLKLLRHSFLTLFRVVAPDSYSSNPASYKLAESACSKLNKFKQEADEAIKSGHYGQEKLIVITSAGKTYNLKKKFATGAITNLFIAEGQVIKVAKLATDNDLLETEHGVLKQLRDKLILSDAGTKWLTVLPKANSSFLLKIDANQHRINVLTHFDNMITLKEAVAKGGHINARTSGWMFKRLITMLPWIHSIGYVHGAILPPHLLVRPDNYTDLDRDPMKHAVVLVDWCYATKIGTRAKAWDAQYGGFYAPEVSQKKPLTEATDIYMVASSIMFAIGADITTNKFPDNYPTALRDVLLSCVNPDPKKRPNSAVLFDRMVEALNKTFGPPKWANFIVPK